MYNSIVAGIALLTDDGVVLDKYLCAIIVIIIIIIECWS